MEQFKSFITEQVDSDYRIVVLSVEHGDKSITSNFLEPSKNYLADFIYKNGEKISSYSPKEISDLKWSLMVELSSYYYSDQSRYILNTFRDSDVKKAIEEMSN